MLFTVSEKENASKSTEKLQLLNSNMIAVDEWQKTPIGISSKWNWRYAKPLVLMNMQRLRISLCSAQW